jgi:hypothetical protein
MQLNLNPNLDPEAKSFIETLVANNQAIRVNPEDNGKTVTPPSGVTHIIFTGEDGFDTIKRIRFSLI